jgi:oxygen-dependent protoporphyrinogen oxidase
MNPPRVVVVGAGIAGLTTAYFLKKEGVDVTLLEAAPRVGGRMATDVVEGYVINNGAQFLSSAYPLLTRLIQEAGLTTRVRPMSPWAAVVRDGQPHRIHADPFFSPLYSQLLPWNSWRRLLWSSLRTWLLIRRLPANDYSQWQGFDHENTAQWCDRDCDNDVLEYLFEPMLEGFYFQSPEETSRALSMAVASLIALRPKTLSLQEGLGSLPEALAAHLHVVLNTPVQAVSVESSPIRIHTQGKVWEADNVVIATTAQIARTLYRSADQLEQRLMNTGYSSTINIAIATNNPISRTQSLKKVYGLLIPRKERRRVAAVGIQSAGAGDLLNIMLSGKAGLDMLNLPDQTIAAQILPEVEKYLPNLSGSIRFIRLYRWKEAVPKSPIGRSNDIHLYRTAATGSRRIFLAGDYMSMPFTEGAAESGAWVATQILGAKRNDSTPPKASGSRFC